MLVHQAATAAKVSKPLDFWIHFSGGAAIAYFLYHAIQAFPAWLKTSSRLGDILFAFALALVTGLCWEFGELASDAIFGTRIQKDVHETLRDLIADTLGAALILALMALWNTYRERRRRKVTITPRPASPSRPAPDSGM